MDYWLFFFFLLNFIFQLEQKRNLSFDSETMILSNGVVFIHILGGNYFQFWKHCKHILHKFRYKNKKLKGTCKESVTIFL